MGSYEGPEVGFVQVLLDKWSRSGICWTTPDLTEST